jgi:hypothetical protein
LEGSKRGVGVGTLVGRGEDEIRLPIFIEVRLEDVYCGRPQQLEALGLFRALAPIFFTEWANTFPTSE